MPDNNNKSEYIKWFEENYNWSPEKVLNASQDIERKEKQNKQDEGILDKAIDFGKQFSAVFGSSIAHIIGDESRALADNLNASTEAYNEFYGNLGLPKLNPELTKTLDKPLLNNVADAAHWVGNKIDEHILPLRKPEASWDYISDPAGLASAAAQVLSSVAALTAPIPFAKRVGVASLGRTLYGLERGATQLPKISKGENIFDMTENAVSKIKLPYIGSLAPYSKGISVGLFTVPMESLAEKGAYIQDALDKGIDYETARDNANGIYLKNLALLSLSNPIQFGILSRLGKVKNRWRYLPMMGAEVGAQTLEEGYQQGLTVTIP